MHETSLILGMIPELEKHMRANNGVAINRVVTTVGKGSGVEINTFQFAFDAVKLDYPWLKNAQMIIEEKPLRYHCRNCNGEFDLDSYNYEPCPLCGSPLIDQISGDELFLASLEIEKNESDEE